MQKLQDFVSLSFEKFHQSVMEVLELQLDVFKEYQPKIWNANSRLVANL